MVYAEAQPEILVTENLSRWLRTGLEVPSVTVTCSPPQIGNGHVERDSPHKPKPSSPNLAG